MSGGGGKSNSNNDTLANLSQQLFSETDPARQEILSQGLQGLRTGGVGALLPLIANAVTQSKSALSQTLQDTQARLGSTGLARSPFGQNVLAGTELSGNQNIAKIGPDMTMNFLSMLPGFVTGTSGQGMSGMAAAAQNTTSQNVASTDMLGRVLAAMMPNVSLTGKLPAFG